MIFLNCFIGTLSNHISSSHSLTIIQAYSIEQLEMLTLQSVCLRSQKSAWLKSNSIYMNWHIFSLFDNSDFVILHNLDLEEMHFLNFITFPLEWFYILTLLIPFHNYITLHHIWNVTLLYLHCVKFITFSCFYVLALWYKITLH